jgi:ABC-type sugar transport system substrate-binding protein
MRIVVVPIAVYDPFFKQVRQGVESARGAIGAENAEIEWLEVQDADPEHQAEILAELRSRMVSAAVVCPVDAELLKKPINECVRAGIPVSTFCLDAPDSGRFYHIGQDLRQSGRLAGFLMGKFLGGKGRVGIITGFFGIRGHEERREGFLEILSNDFPGIDVAWQEENHDHREEAYEIAKKRIDEGGLGGIYVTAGGPSGAAKAVEESSNTKGVRGGSHARGPSGGRVSMICFDFVPETIDYVRKGTIDAAIGQNPFAQGYRSVMAAYDLLQSGKKPQNPIERVHLEIATRENVDYLETH